MQRLDSLALLSADGAVEDQDTASVALVNRSRPVHRPREPSAAHGHTVDLARLDIPDEQPFAESLRRQGIELAGTAPRAVAGHDLVAAHPPTSHRRNRSAMLPSYHRRAWPTRWR